MSTTVDNAYLRGLSEKQKRTNNDAADALLKEFAEPVAPVAAPTPATPAPGAKAPSRTVGETAEQAIRNIGTAFGGPAEEASRAVVGGLRDASQSALDLVDEGATWLDNNFIDLRMQSQRDKDGPVAKTGNFIKLPKVAPNASTPGKIGRGVVQFVAPFMGAVKALRVARGAAAPTTLKGLAAEGVVAGYVADYAAFSPEDKNVANVILDMTDSEPAFGKSMLEYLKQDDANTTFQNRANNANFGAGFGVAAEGAFLALKAAKALWLSTGKNPAEIMEKAAAARKEVPPATVTPTGPVVPPPAPVTTLRDQIDNITGVRSATPGAAKWEKRLDVIKATKDATAEAEEALAASEAASNEMLGFDTLRAAKPAAKEAGATTDLTLRDRVDAMTGVPSEASGIAKWDKRLDVIKATKEDDAANLAEVTSSTLKEAEEAVASGKSPSGHWDPRAGEIVFAKDAPPGSLPLDLLATTALTKAPHLRTAEDLVAIRAYKELQASAFRGLELPGMPTEATLPVTVVEARRGAGKAAMTDAERAAALETPLGSAVTAAVDTVRVAVTSGLDATTTAGIRDAVVEVIRVARTDGLDQALIGRLNRLARAVISEDPAVAVKKLEAELNDLINPQSVDDAAGSGLQIGDTVIYNGGKDSGEVTKVLASGKVTIIDDATGSIKVVTPETDDLMDGVAEANAAFLKAAGRTQGGFISPSVLANMAAGGVGGLVGFAAPGDDASFADRLSAAGLGALAGMGVKAGLSRSKVLTKAEREGVESADELVQSLSRKEMAESIAPLPPGYAKHRPRVSKAAAQDMVDAVLSGDVASIAASVTKADFNFGRMDTDEDVVELINATSAAFESANKVATGGVQTFELIARNADMTGASMATLDRIYDNTAGLSSQMFAHRALLEGSSQNALAMVRMAAASGKPEDIIAATKAMGASVAIQLKVSGIKTEIARAQSAMRMTSSTTEDVRAEMALLINGMGGYENRMALMTKMAELDDLPKLNEAMRKGWMAATRDAITESSVLGKLWSPETQLANVIGQITTLFSSGLERKLAHMINRSDEGVQSGEATALAFGQWAGFQDALRINTDAIQKAGLAALKGNFEDAGGILKDNADSFGSAWHSLASGQPVGRSTLYTGTDDSASQGAISASRFSLPSRDLGGNLDVEGAVNAMKEMTFKEYAGTFLDVFGALTRIPGKGLAAADEVFWAMNYRGEIHAQAHREAARKGLEGDEFDAELVRLIHNPSPEVRSDAIRYALEGTLQTPLKGFPGAVMKGIDLANVGPIPVGRLVVPFVRTPFNIMRWVGHRTPGVNRLADTYKADIEAGGARAELAKAKAVLGSGLYMVGAALSVGFTVNGVQVRILGGGDRRKEAENIGGVLGNSLQIGEDTYALNRMDPMAGVLLMGADISEIIRTAGVEEASDIVTAAALSLGRNVSSKVFLSGVNDMFSAFQEAAKGNTAALKRWADNTLVGAVPFISAANVLKKEDDPIQREVWGLVDTLKSKLPWFSKDLEPVLNIFGEVQPIPKSFGPDGISPIKTRTASLMPAAREIVRLNVDLKRPPRSLDGGDGAPNIDLTAKQYRRYMEIIGELFKPAITDLVTSKQYLDIPENQSNVKYREGKETLIRMIYGKAQEAARNRLIGEDKELQALMEQNEQNKQNALTGQPILEMLGQ